MYLNLMVFQSHQISIPELNHLYLYNSLTVTCHLSLTGAAKCPQHSNHSFLFPQESYRHTEVLNICLGALPNGIMDIITNKYKGLIK